MIVGELITEFTQDTYANRQIDANACKILPDWNSHRFQTLPLGFPHLLMLEGDALKDRETLRDSFFFLKLILLLLEEFLPCSWSVRWLFVGKVAIRSAVLRVFVQKCCTYSSKMFRVLLPVGISSDLLFICFLFARQDDIPCCKPTNHIYNVSDKLT